MSKRKKSKSGKKSPGGGKGTPSKQQKNGDAPIIESALFTAPDPPPPFTTPPTFVQNPSALTPKPALPERKRDRNTRGGKPTTSTHELLAEVPAPPRAKPAAPRKPGQPKPPQTKSPQARPPQSRPPQSRPAQARTPEPHAPAEFMPVPVPSSDAPFSQSQIYETLAALLVPYARKMESEWHPKIGFCLKAKSARTGRETHFGAVQALPDGVAFHLFPLYGHPDLLENVSPELFNRLRGKTCFHFDSLHAGLVAELAALTHAGFERFLSDGVF